MGNFVTGKNNLYQVCVAVCEALGIKHARKLTLNIKHDSIVTVEAEFYPEVDGIKQLVPILKRFELI